MVLEVLFSDKLRFKVNIWELKVIWKFIVLGYKKCLICVVWVRFFLFILVLDIIELGVAKGLCWLKILEGLINDEFLEGEGKIDVWIISEFFWR